MIRVCKPYFNVKNQVLCTIVAFMAMAPTAYAQDFYGEPYQNLDRTHSVAERIHPDYEPLGIHHGSFVVKPSITMDQRYNANIFATPNNKTDDWITTITPRIMVHTLPSTRHDILVDLSASQGLYASNTAENYTDYRAQVRPRLNISKALWLDNNFIFESIHEDRLSANVSQTLAEPLEYDHSHASSAATYKPGLMSFTLGGAWDGYQYDNTDQIGGGQVVQNDRDRSEYRIHGEVAYEFRPNYEAFLRTTANKIKYDRNEFVTGPNTYTGNNRDSTGMDALAGVRFDITSLMRADIGVGYLSQKYDQAGLSDINGVNLHADVAWNVTPLTTLKLGLGRAVQETISTGSSGYLETSMGVGAEHELKRNILLTTGAAHSIQDYEGTTQKDGVTQLTSGITYKMNRNVSWLLQYLYDQRQSNQAGLDYDRNVVMLRAKLKL